MKTPKDIKKLSEQISRFKKSERRFDRKNDVRDADYSRTAMGWQISVELLAAVLIGAGIGYVADNYFSTAPWLLVVFTIMGGAAGFLNIYRSFKAEEKTNKE